MFFAFITISLTQYMCAFGSMLSDNTTAFTFPQTTSLIMILCSELSLHLFNLEYILSFPEQKVYMKSGLLILLIEPSDVRRRVVHGFLFGHFLRLVDFKIIQRFSLQFVVVDELLFVGVRVFIFGILVLEYFLTLGDPSACFFPERIIFIFDLGFNLLDDGKCGIIESARLVLAAIPDQLGHDIFQLLVSMV